jgi:hypothetical protein
MSLTHSPPQKFLPGQELPSDLHLDHLFETPLPGKYVWNAGVFRHPLTWFIVKIA